MWALRPAKPLGVLSRHPCRKPKPLPLGERLCMLGWLCIVQSPCAYTPGIRAGAILLGLPPLDPVGGYAPATPFLSSIEVFRQSGIRCFLNGGFFCLHRSGNALLALPLSPYRSCRHRQFRKSPKSPTPFILHIFEKFFKIPLTNRKSSDIIKPTKSIGF